jgi:hypothetical protein
MSSRFARVSKHVVSTVVSAVAVAGFASVCQAQIGSGWSTDSASHSLQKVGDVYYSNSSGVETFRLNTSDASRCEIKINNSYSSGSHELEGYVKVTGTSRSSGNSVQQILEATTGVGDVSQVRFYSASNGTLKVLQSGVTLATGIYGVYQRVNCIHYRSTGKIELWLNGSKKSTHSDVGSGTYYFKYGMYIAGSAGKPQSQWKSIRVWKK